MDTVDCASVHDQRWSGTNRANRKSETDQRRGDGKHVKTPAEHQNRFAITRSLWSQVRKRNGARAKSSRNRRKGRDPEPLQVSSYRVAVLQPTSGETKKPKPARPGKTARPGSSSDGEYANQGGPDSLWTIGWENPGTEKSASAELNGAVSVVLQGSSHLRTSKSNHIESKSEQLKTKLDGGTVHYARTSGATDGTSRCEERVPGSVRTAPRMGRLEVRTDSTQGKPRN